MSEPSRTLTWILLAGVWGVAFGAAPAPALRLGPIAAEGAYTCDFRVNRALLFEEDPPAGGPIERDRMYMAARPGQLQKHDGLSLDPATQDLRNGGRYLFDTAENAEAYRDWMFNEFDLDGVPFFERPFFSDPECHVWSVVGAHDLADIHTSQVLVRTERWSVPDENQRGLLKDRWPEVLDAAASAHLTGVWLLYNKHERLVSFVYFADRVLPENPAAPDALGLAALAAHAPLGHAVFGDQGWTSTFDLTQWVFFIWFPFVAGDHGEPSLWPNSPPFPEPFAGDGVCEVSRGEDQAAAPEDRAATCGNARPDEGEDSRSCPGDVPFE